MRIVNDNDTRTFTDENGDSLTVLAYVRQRDVERSNELQFEHAVEMAKRLGLSFTDAMEQAKTARGEEQSSNDGPLPAAVRRFRLEAIARELVVGGQTYRGAAIMEAYDKMDAASARWVDQQVAAVWDRALPGDEEREG